MTRVILGLPFAAAITAILFVLMWGMVKPGEIGVLPKVEPPTINIFAKTPPPTDSRIDEPINNKLKAPPPPSMTFTGPTENAGETIGNILPVQPTLGPSAGPVTAAVLLPIAEIAPQYPNRCAARGTEGFATVQYDVTTSGQVTNARIIERSHGCFEDAALNAIRNFRYQPVMGGEGYIARNVIKRFSFTLS